MRFLLDTHTFIWWASAPDRLSEAVLLACQNRNNDLVLSVVSVWEMQIKLQLGKLKLKSPLDSLIETQQRANDLEILPVELRHVLSLSELPPHHKDPIDRMLIAQAAIEGACLVSSDETFSRYSIETLW